MDFEKLRHRMVDEQISRRDIRDPLVLAAMRKVERDKFVPAEFRNLSYGDGPLPIGCNQTISQPYMVAMMTEALQLKGGEVVLEIGTGSGYAAAVLAEIVRKVVTIERLEELADRARALLAELNYDNVTVIMGDGTKGCPSRAPFDGIVVTAGGPEVPQSLRDQLKISGRLVIPVGACETIQTLLRVTRVNEEEFTEEKLCGVRFVPLVGEEGWPRGRHESWSDPRFPTMW